MAWTASAAPSPNRSTTRWHPKPAPAEAPANPIPDRIPNLPEALTLEEAYRIARINSPELKNARSEVQQYLNNIKEVRTGYLPRLTIDVRFAEWDNERDKARDALRFESTDPQGRVALTQYLPTNTTLTLGAARDLTSLDRQLDRLEFTVAQELLQKNTLTRDLSLAKRRAELSLFSERSIMRAFLYEVRSTYFNQLEQSQISARNVERAKEEKQLQEKNERQYESGIIAEYNVLDYRADYNRFQRRQLNSEASTQRARNNLFFVLKVKTPTSSIQFADVDPIPYIKTTWDVARMLESAMQESADVASLRFAIFQSETNLKYYWNDYVPSLQLYGSGIRRRDEELITQQVVHDNEYRFGVRLNWSLIGDQASAYFRELNTKQELEVDRNNLEERFAFYKNKIANDLVELERLRRNYQLNQENVDISSREYELSLLRFETGTISSWDMIRTKNRFFEAQDSLISAKYGFLRHVSGMLRDYPYHELSMRP